MNNKKIKKPKLYLICSIIWFSLWFPLVVWGIYEMVIDKYYMVLPVILVFASQIVFSVFLFLYAKNWCIEILDKDVIITNWRKKVTRYKMDELHTTYRKVLDDTIIIWKGNKKITRTGSFDTNFPLIGRLKIKVNDNYVRHSKGR